MRIAICDDNISTCNDLKAHICKYLNSKQVNYSIDLFFDGSSFLDIYTKSSFDIIFLDIYLGDMIGIDIAKNIRSINEDVIIIFSTSSLDHTLDGFEVNATHYLVKPVDYTKIEKALDRCKSIINSSNKHLTLLSNKTEIRVLLKDILYIEIYNTMSTIHTKYNSIDTYTSLGKLEEMINDDTFLRCHRSYLINMNYIDSMDADNFILENNVLIPIKKNGKKVIREKYLDYLFNSDK